MRKREMKKRISQVRKQRSFFSGIEDEQVFEKRYYIRGGDWILKIDTVIAEHSDLGDPFFAVSFRVIEASKDSMKGDKKRAYPVRKGDKVNWICMLNKRGALSNVKRFLAVAFEKDPDEIDEDLSERSVSEENPLQGIIIHCDAQDIILDNGHNWTTVEWELVDANWREDIEKDIEEDEYEENIEEEPPPPPLPKKRKIRRKKLQKKDEDYVY
jgi:hypothetical protein